MSKAAQAVQRAVTESGGASRRKTARREPGAPPKNKYLCLNTDVARAATAKALSSALKAGTVLSETEAAEAAKLLARLASRGATVAEVVV